jgi:Zn-dependent peptidase ImmA (M78 family)
MLYKWVRELAGGGKKPLEIAADLGIRVLFVPFKEIKGIVFSLCSDKFILIDDDLTEIEQQIVCGHEIGHFLLHPSTNFLFILEKPGLYNKQEHQANHFACALMLGEESEKYSSEIKKAAAQGRLDRLVEVVMRLIGRDEYA